MAKAPPKPDTSPPAYLNLHPFATAEWTRVVSELTKQRLFRASDRALMEFYIVNYQNFVLGTIALAEIQKEEAEALADEHLEPEERRVLKKEFRLSKRGEQDNINTAISRGLMLSQKLYLNPNDRRRGKVNDTDGKSALDKFLDD
jgi:phage terminase small subunit